MEKLRPLTDDETAVLVAYAAKHGRRWKAALSSAWMGMAPHDDTGLLRSLRNTHGPSWLVAYRLPKAAKAAEDGGDPDHPG